MRLLREMFASLWASYRFRGYQPQPVTPRSFWRWLRQFSPDDRDELLRLLDRVVYLRESDVRDALVFLNRVLLADLQKAGIAINKIIYVQVHDAGSSSPVMLNMLRESARLSRAGCHFMDSNDVLGLNKLTNELEEGAIVYVDDFAGSGNQFCKHRKFIGEYILGSFSEFFLVPSLCEEAVYQLGQVGVEPRARIIHAKADRPLHPQCALLSDGARKRLVQLCEEMNPKYGLGYNAIASNVILYRNAPNTTPLILRGSLRQKPRVGIFPRFDDLPELAKA